MFVYMESRESKYVKIGHILAKLGSALGWTSAIRRGFWIFVLVTLIILVL